ncbi:MAG: Ig-like domain-containing protein, partial [bacterium]|nr:Ig-like domain-containing protein [bacterium]
TFEYKLTHYPSANVPTRRIERYRLPEGAKLVLLQPKELVQRVVNGRIEFGRDEMVPVDGGVTTHFRYRLPGAKLSEAAMVRDEEEEAPAFKPSVVSTVPASGATDVDPALSEIRVTFDRDMETDRMWSWVQESADTFPEVAGDIHYLDNKRTCVLPCKLQPGRTYIIWVNSSEYQNFRCADFVAAVPYRLTFTTSNQ